MGSICPLNPEFRAIRQKNSELKLLIKNQIKGLDQYDFVKSVRISMNEMQNRYLYNQGILEDIQKIHSVAKSSMSRKTENSQQLQDELKNSCLILQNEQQKEGDGEQKYTQSQNASFCNHMKQNQSLVEQINILYKKQIKISEYSQSLYIFLKWANTFQEHIYGGFLKPIFRQFSNDIALYQPDKLNDLIVQVQQFGQFMVSLITKIYGLKNLCGTEAGRLIKNDNVYNLVMCILFKKTKIRKYIFNCFDRRDFAVIDSFQKSLLKLKNKPISFFGVSSKFTLYMDCSILTETQKTKSSDQYVQPYHKSLKLVEQLCQSGSPITKLKIIINISKQIMKQIKEYYQSKRKEIPQIDPDNLCAIIMYLLAHKGKKEIYHELKIVQNFTTSNCLNCISGYYLNVFLAAVESLCKM